MNANVLSCNNYSGLLLFTYGCVSLCAAPDGVPTPLPVTEDDKLSPRQVRLSWIPIPAFQWNGEPLFYEARVVSLDQDPNRKKRQADLAPNSPEACFLAANALFEFTEVVSANETSVPLVRLSK